MADRAPALARFFTGAGYLTRGLGFVRRHRGLWGWVAAPAIVTTLATIALVWAMAHWGSAWVDGKMVGHGVVLGFVVWIFFWALLLAAGIVGFIVLSSVGTAPFAGFISEKTEQLAQGAVTLAPVRVGALRGLVEMLVALALYLLVSLGVLMLNLFVPLLSPAWLALGFVATAIYLAYDNLDLPLGRRGLDASGKWAWLRTHRAETLGFGMMTAVFFLVPGLGLVVPAVAVTGGTLLCIDLEQRR